MAYFDIEKCCKKYDPSPSEPILMILLVECNLLTCIMNESLNGHENNEDSYINTITPIIHTGYSKPLKIASHGKLGIMT